MKNNNISYMFKEAFTNFFKNGFMSVASIGVMVSCLLILGSSYLIIININKAIQNVVDMNEIVLFLNFNVTQELVERVEKQIEEHENTKEYIFISKDQALESYIEDYSENADILEELRNDNPLSHSMTIILKDISKTDESIEFFSQIGGVRKIKSQPDVTKNLVSLRNIISSISIGFLAVFIIMTLFIISNNVKLSMQSRKREINIMKFVGATNWFIRWPFIIEGMIIGLVSAISAFFIESLIYQSLMNEVLANIDIIKLIDFENASNFVLLAFIGVAVSVGTLASSISVRKYLKV